MGARVNLGEVSWVLLVVFALVLVSPTLGAPPEVGVAGTRVLDWEGDLADRMVSGIDRFLLERIARAGADRGEYWAYDTSSPEGYLESVAGNRAELRRILGVRDERVDFEQVDVVAGLGETRDIALSDRLRVTAVRWPVLGYPGPEIEAGVAVHGEGLLIEPRDGAALANVIAIPDAGQSPEDLVGLTEKGESDSSVAFARRLAERGCRVLVPTLISRTERQRGGRATMTDREYLYRPAFELGRGLIGYELQKVLAGVDWFSEQADVPIGVIGYGEGGMLALYAGAIDPRIDATLVSGYWGPRDGIWNEPISRNVFGRLTRFGDAEIASLIVPRRLVISPAGGPEVTLEPGKGGAPAELTPVSHDAVVAEVERLYELVGEFAESAVTVNSDPVDAAGPTDLKPFFEALGLGSESSTGVSGWDVHREIDVEARYARQLGEIERHTQWLLAESPYIREEFMGKLDTSSLESYKTSVEEYRTIFAEEVIGRFDDPLLPANPRTRKTGETDASTRYDVVLDVYPDVFAYGVLIVPKDIQPGERRPVVVFQHGLEGRPEDVITGDHRAYHNVSARLAERGFITFSPQNPYIFKDRFRTLQRKSNAMGKTLFSTINAQHQQIVDWLQTLPMVDGDRVGFYGLSYGGKSAMRIPAVVTDYCLSICSGDFNDWIDKNASARGAYSYVWHGEYEIFEFDLGMTFNYSDMAALICPRPFMVERGHFDGVATDQAVGSEFAKVRRLYAAKLGIPDQCEIEWFVGPHTVHGVGTFEFLHEHLGYPGREGGDSPQ